MLLTLWCTACKSPQQRDLVVRAMRPVLHQVGHQHDQKQRDKEIETGSPSCASPSLDGPARTAVHQQIGRQQTKPIDHVVDDEVLHVGLPLGPEHRLRLRRSANSFSMKMKISEEPSRSSTNQSRPMYGVSSAKSFTGTFVATQQRAAEAAISVNAPSASQRARLSTMLNSANPPADHHRPVQQQAHHVDAVGLRNCGVVRYSGK